MDEDLGLRILPRSVTQEVVERLKAAILAGRFAPGDRLVEAELCSRFGVSRASVREALRILQAERLIEMIPNRGPQIPRLTLEDARQIYEVRALLEGRAAALCAVNATAQDLAAMGAALEEFRRAVETDEEQGRVLATARFYAVVMECSKNKVIKEVLDGLLARINYLRLRSMSKAGRAKSSLEEMQEIFEAIRDRDADRARVAAELHVMRARNATEVIGTS